MYLLQVPAMSCEGCVRAITRSLQRQDSSASVEHTHPQQLRVATQLTQAQLVQALEDAGYGDGLEISHV